VKNFLEKIKSGIKKLWEMITNKWLLKGTTTVILIAIVIACFFGVNWIVEKLQIDDIDLTSKKLYSISTETKNKLKELKEDVKIQIINMSEYTYLIDFAKKYAKESEKVTVEVIKDASERVDLQTKYNITGTESIIVVASGAREKILLETDLYTVDYSTYETIDVTEEAITNAILEVTIAEKPHIYVYTGKTYYAPEQVLSTILYQLEGEVNQIDPLDILSTGNVPEDCDCLVLTTLKQDLSEIERDKILDYIKRGGNILMLSSQNIIEVDTPNFDKVLEQYGISIGYGAIFEQDTSKMLSGSPELIISDVISL